MTNIGDAVFENAFQVKGRVAGAGGVVVRAFDRDLRNDEPLGDSGIGPGGRYEITYTAEQFARAEKRSADLQVRVYDETECELARSETRFNAGADETIDVTLPAAPLADGGEYERYVAELSPLMMGVPFAELVENTDHQDLSFLNGDTGIPKDRIGWLRDAHRMDAGELGPEVFYAWLRKGLPGDPDGLWSTPPAQLVAALRAAIDEGIVPRRLDENFDGLAERIRDEALRRQLRPAADGQPPSLGDILRTMPGRLTPAKQRRAVEAVLEVPVDDPEFGQRLHAARLSRGEARQVERTVRLAQLTGFHYPVLTALQPVIAADQDASLRGLAAMGPDDWLDLAYVHGSPAGSSLAPFAYAARLQASVEELHPAATLVARLERGSLRFDHPGIDDARDFLARDPGFDLIGADLGALLEGEDGTTAAGVEALRMLRGLKRLGTSWSETAALVGNGFGRVGEIADAVPETFALRVADDIAPGRASEIHASAGLARDAGVAIMVAASPRFAPVNSPGPADGAIDPSLLGDGATLRQIFGDLDDCGCQECRSLTGPLRYFADLMDFVRRHDVAWRQLMQRRPGLADLELSCPNAEQEMPYIDLVLETLENAVALPLPVPLPAGQHADAVLAATPLHDSIYQVLRTTCRSIADRAGLAAVKETIPLLAGEATAWIVRDAGKRWTLHRVAESLTLTKPGTPPSVLALSGAQPSAVAAELDASQIPAGLMTAFRDSLVTGSLSLFGPAVVTVEPGLRWRLDYRVGVRIEIEVTGASGMLRVEAEDGTLIAAGQRPSALLVALAQGLDANTIDGPFLPLIGPLLPVTATATEPGKRWTVTSGPRSADLAFYRDELTVVSLCYQSSAATSADVIALPEYRNPAAYDGAHLGGARFPWTLPFDLPLTEVRTYLERARTSRLALMEAVDPSRRLTSEPVAREVLGLSRPDTDIIQGDPASAAARWEEWGLKVSGGQATIRDTSVDQDVTDTPLHVLARASILVQQSGLSWPELLAIAGTDFVRAAGGLSASPPDECRLSRVQLPVTPEHLDRIHRFTRIWRALGWRVDETDIAIGALSLDVARLAAVERLHGRLGRPVDELLSWWAGLGGRTYQSYEEDGTVDVTPVFERVFQNPALGSPAERPLRLSGDRTALVVAGGAGAVPAASAYLAPVGAALGAAETDLLALIGPGGEIADTLDLASLSRLHAVTGLAQALGLSIEDYRRARRLSGIDPFAGPAEAVQFVEAADFVRASGFTPEEVSFLLRDDVPDGSPLPLDDESMQEILRRIAELPADQPPPAATPSQSSRADRVVALLASELKMDTSLLSVLIRGKAEGPLLVCPGTTRAAIEALLEIPVPAAGQPVQAPQAETVVRRLHKTALVWQRLKITPVDLRWMTPPMRVLDPNQLPDQRLGAGDATREFEAWRALTALCVFRAQYAHADELLAQYVDKLRQSPPDLAGARALLAPALYVDPQDVDGVFGDLQIGVAATDADHYADPLRLQQALAALVLTRRLTVSWTQLKLLGSAEPGADAATAARRLMTTKFGAEQWRELVKPIADQLRQRQRDALVGYLVARNGLRDADDLYDYFLIDPQRAPCFITSRIVEATGALPQFIEPMSRAAGPGAALTQAERDQLPYLLDRRLAEARYSVFLTPWRWLHSELRDDKTQPFRNFEAALSQDEPSAEIAHDAMLGYLEELAELDQMKILAVYEHVPPPESGVDPVLYVIGRTADKPFQYYLRSCTNLGSPETMRWAGWERLDLDIPGDHVFPFVFEGDLHIAWPTIDKTDSPGGNEQDALLAIHLAWSRLTRNGWTKRKVSKAPIPDAPQLLPGRNETDGLAFRVFEQSRLAQAEWPDPAGWNVPSLRSLTVNDVTIRCYAGEPESLPPVPTASITLLPVLRNQADPFAKTVYIFQVTVYKEFAPGGTSSGRYAPAHDVEVSLQFINDPHEPDPIVLGKTRAGLLLATLVHDENTSPVTLTLTASDPLLGPHPAVSQEVGFGSLGAQVIVTCTLVVQDTNDEPPPREELAEGIPIGMSAQGEFVFSTGRDVIADFAPDSIGVQHLLDGTVSSGGGYLEARPRASSSFTMSPDRFGTKPPALLAHTSGRFEAVGPRPPSPRGDIWHYADDNARYYLYTPADAAGGRGLSGLRDQDHLTAVRPGAGDSIQRTRSMVLVLSDKLGIAPFLRIAASVSMSSLYDPDLQAATDGGKAFASQFSGTYQLDPGSIPAQGVSFEHRSPLGVYAWELWLHTRMRAWQRLAQAGHYDEALEELRYVWDPDGGDGGWRVLPLQKVAAGDSVRDALEWLAAPAGHEAAIAAFKQQFLAWRQDPFQPHAVARLRPSAYMWRTVLDCVDMLIGSGDQLQAQGTRIALERAARQYVKAARILGRRPVSGRPQADQEVLTYRDLVARPGDYSYGWERILDQPGMPQIVSGNGAPASPNLGPLGSLYFCVPPDTMALDYWDRVDRRLSNLRNCRDIDGNPLVLQLYDPPIDPDLLVRARAAGLDINAVLGRPAARPPRWRFSAALARALQVVASDFISVDDAYLAAREKLDAEQLALMESAHGIELLRLGSQLKDEQIREAEQNIKALTQARKNAGERWQHYQRLLGRQDLTVPPVGTRASRESAPLHVAPPGALVPTDASLALLQTEVQQLELNAVTHILSLAVSSQQIAAAVAYAIGAYVPAAPAASAVGSGINATASAIGTLASDFSHVGGMLATIGGYERRRAEAVLQSNSSAGELDHLGEQILAEQIRLGLTQLEKGSQQRQLEQAIDRDEYLRLEKFTKLALKQQLAEQARELRYVWFQLVQERMLEVEACYKFELGEDPPPSDLAGPPLAATDNDLLLGRRLLHDLRRIEASYNQRRAEPRHALIKNVSLRRLDPAALLKLRATGTCSFSLTELDYDMDFPGQWDRRFKAIRASVHCVTGRYEGVNCILTKTVSKTRTTGNPAVAGPLPLPLLPDPPADCSIAISTGKGDSGRFELNLNDDLLLPGEHQGAISDWTLDIASPVPGYDSDTIADVVLEVMYTAQEATSTSRSQALGQLSHALDDAAGSPLALLVSLRHDVPGEWQRLTDAARQQRARSSVILPFGQEKFPLGFQAAEWSIKIAKIELYLRLMPATLATFGADELRWTVTGPGMASWPGGTLIELLPAPSRAFTASAAPPGPAGGAHPAGAPGDWTLEIWRPGIAGDEAVEADALKDVLVVCHYAAHHDP